MHGMFNSQFYGIWQLIFPQVDPLLGGITGLTGLAILVLPAVWALLQKTKKIPASD